MTTQFKHTLSQLSSWQLLLSGRVDKMTTYCHVTTTVTEVTRTSVRFTIWLNARRPASGSVRWTSLIAGVKKSLSPKRKQSV